MFLIPLRGQMNDRYERTKLMATYELLQENSWYVLWAITGQRADQWCASNAQVRLTGPPAGRGSVSDTDRRNVSAEMKLPLALQRLWRYMTRLVPI